MRPINWMLIVSTVAAVVGPGHIRAQSPDYRDQLSAWREEQETALKADNSWLTVAGLFFLREGNNTFGSGPLNDIVLPSSAPTEAGIVSLADGVIEARALPGGTLTVNGQVVERAVLRPASAEAPADQIALGPLTLFVHRSGSRLAMRLRDLDSPLRRNFSGLRWFPIDERFRVTGRFVPFDSPKTMPIQNILGDVSDATASGYVRFTLLGQEHRLVPIDEDDHLFFVFRDLTSGIETYAAVRFLYTPLPVNGEVILDFNKAENPPCAYNPYTTCPLPPPENRLNVRIEAGEMIYEGRE
jgi:uncharacterized protein (DUF1684 family)